MGEITLEKKKQIENYIVASYFDRCKNVESYIGGCDIVYGSKSDDIPDILVEVENFSGSGFMIVRWNIIHDQVSEWQNEFMVRIATERSITRNRCDSVDALNYAWVSWKKQLEEKTIFLKDKRIENLEKEIKALKAEKEAMEAHIQELEKRNEINKQMRDLYKSHLNEWWTATDCSTPEDAKKVFTAAKEEIRVQTDNAYHYREQLDGFVELYDELADKHKELESQIEEWKTTTKCNTPSQAAVVISTLTKVVVFNDMNKDCPLDFEIKFVRGDEK